MNNQRGFLITTPSSLPYEFSSVRPGFFLGNLLPPWFSKVASNSRAFRMQKPKLLIFLSRQVGAKLPAPWSCSWSRRSSCRWSYGSRDLAWWIGSRRSQTESFGPLNKNLRHLVTLLEIGAENTHSLMVLSSLLILLCWFPNPKL